MEEQAPCAANVYSEDIAARQNDVLTQVSLHDILGRKN